VIVDELRKMAGSAFSTWDTHVDAVQLHINSSTNRSLGMSPEEALYGIEPQTAVTRETGVTPDPVSGPEELRGLIKAVQDRVKLACERAFGDAKRAYDEQRKAVVFAPGDKVRVYVPNRDNKLDRRWRYPYEIVKKVNDNVYVVRDMNLLKDQKMHVERIMPFDASRTSDDIELELLLPEGSSFVDKVLDHREDGKWYMFRVQWRNEPAKDATWEYASNIKSVQAYLDYCAAHDLPTDGLVASKSKKKKTPAPKSAAPTGTARRTPAAPPSGRGRRAAKA